MERRVSSLADLVDVAARITDQNIRILGSYCSQLGLVPLGTRMLYVIEALIPNARDLNEAFGDNLEMMLELSGVSRNLSIRKIENRSFPIDWSEVTYEIVLSNEDITKVRDFLEHAGDDIEQVVRFASLGRG